MRPRAQPGQPIRAAHIQQIIERSHRAVQPTRNAIVGTEGAAAVDITTDALRLAQLISPWFWEEHGSAYAPRHWPWAMAQLVGRVGNEFGPLVNRAPIRVWAPAGYPGRYRDDMRNPATPEFTVPYAPGDWIWVTYQRQARLWLLVSTYYPIILAQLTEKLYACASAQAITAREFQFTVYDLFGRVTEYRYVLADEQGYFVDKYTKIVAQFLPEIGEYVLLYIVDCMTPPSASSGSSSTGSSGSSGSVSSRSESSRSESSRGSSVSSRGSESSVESESRRSESRGSEKSSAIVPASWSPTGYVALFIHEMPEVRFDDVMVATVPMQNQDLRIDPRFVEVCERGSIEVCGISVDRPVLVGARALTDRVRLTFEPQDPTHAVRIVMRLTGIRRGFAGKRFPRRTREQFLANEAFINSAYPSDPRAE